MLTKQEKLMTEFDHDWNDLSLFEKLPVRKTANPKRDNWKRDRKAARNAKRTMQEKNYA
jgi:hypothetical protein